MDYLPRVFAVTGNPVLHSKSPEIFNKAFKDNDIEAVYTRLAADSAKEAMQLAKEIGLSGLNVTAPFKEDIIAHLDSLDCAAEKIGAVNTVVFDDNESRGYNTDHIGVVKALESAGLIKLNEQKALVLGAGGAGRGAAYGLINAGCRVTIANRSIENAMKASSRLGCRAISLAEIDKEIGEADIIINTIPVNGIIKRESLHSGLTVFDANYKNSELEGFAKVMGCRFVSGFEWLRHQASPAFELFTGVKGYDFELDKSEIRAHQSISLIGFMLSGKTTVGRILADMLGREFIDTDSIIENYAQMTIPEIFKVKGEARFRALERRALKKALGSGSAVISCGGGIVLYEKNIELLKNGSIPVWLYANSAEITKRYKADRGQRPLLKENEAEKRIDELLRIRMPIYSQAAMLVVNTAKESPEIIAKKIFEEIRVITEQTGSLS